MGRYTGEVRVDLHSHSMWSKDSTTTLEEIIGAVEASPLDALALTDHDEIAGALALAEIAPFPVIVGEEIKTADGEIIGLFLKRLIPPGLTPEATVAEIHAQGGLAYVPHPFDGIRGSTLSREALDHVSGLVDALEIYNGRCLFPHFNERAAHYAAEAGLPGGAGSDAHRAEELGSVYVEIPDVDLTDSSAFLRALATGRIVGKASGPMGRLGPSAARMRRIVGAWRRRARASGDKAV